MTVIKIRKGLNGFPFSICSEDGRFIGNARSIEEIRKIYEYETKNKIVKIVKETALLPSDAKIPPK